MSVVAGEVVTEEEVEDLAEDSLCSSYVSDTEKKLRKKKVSGRPPPSPRSPYLNSASLHLKRTPVASWRTVKGTQLQNCKTPPAGTPKDVWLHLQNDGHGTLSKSLKRADYSVTQTSISMTSTPEYLKEALGMKKPKYSLSSSNGYVPGTPDYKEKEEMYDEIIDLKKTIRSQKTESDKMKAKLRRLEEENAKKDRQIEQLLDPTKDPEYARGLVDRKTDPRSIINGLKQRIVRLEQQYKEKENALSQLQSDLKTTNMQEMKITVETYFEEVQRLRALLESTERSNKAESKNIRGQNKTLSATVLKLTNTVQHLENENQELKKELTQEEMNMMESPACRAKGYMDWSKQRLVRRILELEKRVEQMKNLQITKASDSLKSPDNKGTQSESANQSDSVNTEMEPSVITENDAHLRETVKKLEEEKKELEGKLTQKDEEIKQLSAEKDKSLKEVENMLKEQIREHERLMQTHRQEMGALTIEISCLKEKLEEERKLRLVQDPSQVRDGSLSLTLTEPLSSSEVVPIEKNRAAKIIQTHWRSHRTRDLVLLQSCLRGHLIRQRQLDGQRQADPRTVPVAMSQSGMNTQAVQEEEVTLLQSVFRAHLKRSTLTMDRVSAVTQSVSSKHQKKLYLSTPPLLPRGSSQAMFTNKTQTSGVTQNNSEETAEELNPAYNDKLHDKRSIPAIAALESKREVLLIPKLLNDLKIHQHQPGNQIPKTIDSDDSDDIIVSPSKPLRKKKILKSVQ
ncbi:IQ domain-containing protein E-like isoform X2 [Sinocyclocheilus rhinocerous]|uniref:IQ domain-containing protein E-like isoform X2 n=1 Tax=Sinocyclocheilus rhinocerous TaxID=307959 RepID=UPI0007BA92C5|nr:PREDICTED: IQ domain-containing protein E-like isoform X2 [Sinocyclocheilus rhinocerous]